jgi:hypothetical protein
VWFWWGGHAADCRTLWRQVFDIFQQEGVRNVIWMWAAADTCTVQCNVAGFYPGDDVVDILGLNAYLTAPALPASSPGVGSMIDASTPGAARQAFDQFVRHERIVHRARWNR